MSFAPPSTPPKKTKSRLTVFKSPMNLTTPQTSSLKKIKDVFATPSSTSKSKTPFIKTQDSYGDRNNFTMPITPEFTPQKSPRAHRKRRNNVEDILRSESTTNDQEGNINLLLPTSSTVGTGRKPIQLGKPMKPPSLTFDSLSKLNDNLKFESDEDEEMNDEDFFKADNSNKKSGDKSSFVLKSNLLKSPTSVAVPASPTKSRPVPLPNTPGHQLIDDDKINRWHGTSFKNRFDFDDEDVDDDEDFKSTKPLVNPFLADSTNSSKNINLLRNHNPFNPSKPEIDYNTHAEYVNNKTGEKRVVKLLERQANIKPKKLDFSSAM